MKRAPDSERLRERDRSRPVARPRDDRAFGCLTIDEHDADRVPMVRDFLARSSTHGSSAPRIPHKPGVPPEGPGSLRRIATAPDPGRDSRSEEVRVVTAPCSAPREPAGPRRDATITKVGSPGLGACNTSAGGAPPSTSSTDAVAARGGVGSVRDHLAEFHTIAARSPEALTLCLGRRPHLCSFSNFGSACLAARWDVFR
jgi:hypothetical protein